MGQSITIFSSPIAQRLIYAFGCSIFICLSFIFLDDIAQEIHLLTFYLIPSFIFIFIICKKLCSDERRRIDYFNPFSLFSALVAISILWPVVFRYTLNIDIYRYFASYHITDEFVFNTIIILHIILIFSSLFIFCLLGANRSKDAFFCKTGKLERHFDFRIWSVVAIIILPILIIFNISDAGPSLFLSQIESKVGKIEAILLSILIFSYLLKTDDRLKCLIIIFTVGAFLVFYNVLIHQSRGIIFIFISMCAFAEYYKWRGTMLSNNFYSLGILFIPVIMHGVTFIEILVLENLVTSNFLRKIGTGIETRILENAATVLYWTEQEGFEFRNGRSYFDAVWGLIPSQFVEKNPTLSEWFAMTAHPDAWRSGAGFAFSAVAEGLVNFGQYGVVLQGFVVGFMLRLLDWMRTCAYPVLIISSATAYPLIYKLSREEIHGFVHRLPWSVALVLGLFALYRIIWLVVNSGGNSRAV